MARLYTVKFQAAKIHFFLTCYVFLFIVFIYWLLANR